MKGLFAGLVLAAAATPLSAQVGFPPERSPYRDLEYKREWTWFGGYFNARRDPENIAPRDGPLVGVRYDMRLAGPTYISGRIATAFLPRNILDPKQPIGDRYVGEETVPLMLSDLGFGLNLTGFRSWRHLVPFVSTGLGFASDLTGRRDVGDYRFGAQFAFNFGGGAKWTKGRFQARLDWTNYLYQIKYPSSYFIRSGADDPPRLPGQPENTWRRNVSWQLGLSYLIGR